MELYRVFPIQFVGTSDLVFRGILTDMAGQALYGVITR